MNRYIVQGIINDLHQGKRVALIGPRRVLARHVFMDVIHTAPAEGIRRVTVSNGNEQVDMLNGGRLTVAAATRTGLRGVTLDVLVLLDWRDINRDNLDDTLAVLNATGGELIQA